MRDLHQHKRHRPPQPPRQNRVKVERKPTDWKGIGRKAGTVAGWLVGSVAVVAIGWGSWRFVSSLRFCRLEQVDVGNLKRLSRDELLELAGVRQGDSLLALNLRAMGQQVAKNPWVQEVTIRRYFPHTLAIRVTEREPVAVVNLNFLYYLDRRGEVFKPLNHGDRLDYPLVTGLSEEDLGRDPAGCRELLQGAVQLIDLLQRGQVLALAEISEIHLDKGFGYTLFTSAGGVPVRLGKGELAGKLARLGKVFGDLKPQLTQVQYIDLDYGDKIIVKKA